MNKALFLDRDGILNRVIIRNGIVSSPRHIDELEIIHEAIELVQVSRALGFHTILITNQPDVSRGKMTLYQLRKIHRKIKEVFPLDRLEVCMSFNNRCFRRKPNPGMLFQSARKLNIDLSKSLFLGDSKKDIEAGKRAGVKTILYQRDYNVGSHGIGDFNCNDFNEIMRVLEHDNDR